MRSGCVEVTVHDDMTRATLYIDSTVNCEEVLAGDSPCSLGSSRPHVSRDVVRHPPSSRTRTVDRAAAPVFSKVEC